MNATVNVIGNPQDLDGLLTNQRWFDLTGAGGEEPKMDKSNIIVPNLFDCLNFKRFYAYPPS